MRALTKKQAILQSLESLNASETEKVFSYIKNLLYQNKNDPGYEKLRHRAMKEIRRALKQERGVNLAS